MCTVSLAFLTFLRCLFASFVRFARVQPTDRSYHRLRFYPSFQEPRPCSIQQRMDFEGSDPRDRFVAFPSIARVVRRTTKRGFEVERPRRISFCARSETLRACPGMESNACDACWLAFCVIPCRRTSSCDVLPSILRGARGNDARSSPLACRAFERVPSALRREHEIDAEEDAGCVARSGRRATSASRRDRSSRKTTRRTLRCPRDDLPRHGSSFVGRLGTIATTRRSTTSSSSEPSPKGSHGVDSNPSRTSGNALLHLGTWERCAPRAKCDFALAWDRIRTGIDIETTTNTMSCQSFHAFLHVRQRTSPPTSSTTGFACQRRREPRPSFQSHTWCSDLPWPKNHNSKPFLRGIGGVDPAETVLRPPTPRRSTPRV